MNAPREVRPLPARAAALPGESLASLVRRTAEAMGYEGPGRVRSLLADAGNVPTNGQSDPFRPCVGSIGRVASPSGKRPSGNDLSPLCGGTGPCAARFVQQFPLRLKDDPEVLPHRRLGDLPAVLEGRPRPFRTACLVVSSVAGLHRPSAPPRHAVSCLPSLASPGSSGCLLLFVRRPLAGGPHTACILSGDRTGIDAGAVAHGPRTPPARDVCSPRRSGGPSDWRQQSPKCPHGWKILPSGWTCRRRRRRSCFLGYRPSTCSTIGRLVSKSFWASFSRSPNTAPPPPASAGDSGCCCARRRTWTSSATPRLPTPCGITCCGTMPQGTSAARFVSSRDEPIARHSPNGLGSPKPRPLVSCGFAAGQSLRSSPAASSSARSIRLASADALWACSCASPWNLCDPSCTMRWTYARPQSRLGIGRHAVLDLIHENVLPRAVRTAKGWKVPRQSVADWEAVCAGLPRIKEESRRLDFTPAGHASRRTFWTRPESTLEVDSSRLLAGQDGRTAKGSQRNCRVFSRPCRRAEGSARPG